MRTLRPGPTKLLEVPGVLGDDDTSQVAVAWPQDGTGPAILVRFGRLAVALSLEGADALAEDLADAVVQARLDEVDRGPVQ